jgi:hypothetical protein
MRQSFGESSAEHRQLAEWLRELRNIKAENEKLWERVFELEELTDHRHYIPQEWYATLQVENAKLKELCSDLMGWIAYTTMGESVPEETYCALEDRMTALGIEGD